MHVLGLIRSGGLAGTNRPDRFVGNHSFCQRANTLEVNYGVQLTRDHLFGNPLLAFFQQLANTQDRH